MEAVNAANKPVVGSAPDAFAEFGVVAARLQVAFKSHMPSSAWCVCRVCWSVEAAGDGLCGDPQTSLCLGYPKFLLVTRCQQSAVYFKPRFSLRRSRNIPRDASLKRHREGTAISRPCAAQSCRDADPSRSTRGRQPPPPCRRYGPDPHQSCRIR